MTCRYGCCVSRCTHEFTAAGPLGPSAQCPKCGSLYVEWSNFRSWHRSAGKSEKYCREYGVDGVRQ